MFDSEVVRFTTLWHLFQKWWLWLEEVELNLKITWHAWFETRPVLIAIWMYERNTHQSFFSDILHSKMVPVFQVLQLYLASCAELPAPYSPGGVVNISPHHIQVNRSFLPRQWNQEPTANQREPPLFLLHHTLAPLESLMKCVEMKWMAILVRPV